MRTSNQEHFLSTSHAFFFFLPFLRVFTFFHRRFVLLFLVRRIQHGHSIRAMQQINTQNTTNAQHLHVRRRLQPLVRLVLVLCNVRLRVHVPHPDCKRRVRQRIRVACLQHRCLRCALLCFSFYFWCSLLLVLAFACRGALWTAQLIKNESPMLQMFHIHWHWCEVLGTADS